MDLLAEVLKPIPVVVWGGPALEHRGLMRKIQGYFFIVNECDRDLAKAKLLGAGFIRAHWSWGSCDPAKLQTMDGEKKRIHEASVVGYEDIDNNSVRFAFPPEYGHIGNEIVALLFPSFAGLGPPHATASGSNKSAQGETQNDGTSTRLNKALQKGPPLQQKERPHHKVAPDLGPVPQSEPENLKPANSVQNAKPIHDAKNELDTEKVRGKTKFHNNSLDDSMFTCFDGFLYYPHLPVLLESLIRARLRLPENAATFWALMLEVWAITYLWAQTMAPEDVLDGIEDEKVKAWFNKAIKRFEGGIDRVTITKRKGRVKSTRPPVDLNRLFEGQDQGSSNTETIK
ncbi:hypothetical protein GQ53DRAFT_812420 [Thozetella sp. PMI_491]|nr:hypothetical protein GQ53DRAFT_812420 [Thozetella sp. PMI_491]